ncbi:synaptonemal complex protein 4 isoform X3 [Trichoplusia ni]|nr:synaptonemal complex protein 4 isoform X3 [Trichoplusia ni]
MVLQTFGPVVLRLFLGNRNGGGNTGGGTVELDDDDDDDDDDEPASASPTTTTTTTASSVGDDSSPEAARRRRRRALFLLPNALAEENQLLSGAESQQAEVRVAFGEPAADQQPAASDDQQVAAQTNAASIDEITLDDADSSEENRNKRFLSFGGSAGGSGGGSGNFLFDIVRLVAGSSSGSSSGDAGAGADGEDASAAKGDNLTEGVPGPITRLFIIANRGIANLIQDLILRIAQTSERIVNFKARLITSII